MKKILLVLLLLVFIISCQNDSNVNDVLVDRVGNIIKYDEDLDQAFFMHLKKIDNDSLLLLINSIDKKYNDVSSKIVAIKKEELNANSCMEIDTLLMIFQSSCSELLGKNQSKKLDLILLKDFPKQVSSEVSFKDYSLYIKIVQLQILKTRMETFKIIYSEYVNNKE